MTGQYDCDVRPITDLPPDRFISVDSFDYTRLILLGRHTAVNTNKYVRNLAVEAKKSIFLFCFFCDMIMWSCVAWHSIGNYRSRAATSAKNYKHKRCLNLAQSHICTDRGIITTTAAVNYPHACDMCLEHVFVGKPEVQNPYCAERAEKRTLSRISVRQQSSE